MNLEIKGLRTMPGREGEAYSFQLHIDGKPAATVLNEGNSGSTRVYWHQGQNCEVAKAFEAHVASQPPVKITEGDPAFGLFPGGDMPMDQDLFLAQLVDQHVAAKRAALMAWGNVVNYHRPLSPLLRAIGRAIRRLPDENQGRDFMDCMSGMAKRIAGRPQIHCDIAALEYSDGWAGRWTVTNRDLLAWSTFCMWISRYNTAGWVVGEGVVTRALQMKRMQQAYDRYRATGLRYEHCKLLENLSWGMDTSRGDWVSLFVQGKRPFGNSGCEGDIYEHAGWPMDWGDEGMSGEQEERAWNLFDELAFAAPDAARMASKALSKS